MAKTVWNTVYLCKCGHEVDDHRVTGKGWQDDPYTYHECLNCKCPKATFDREIPVEHDR